MPQALKSLIGEVRLPAEGSPAETAPAQEVDEIMLWAPNRQSLKVQIVLGDITEESSQAIVNPTDQFLEFTEGVGAQLVQKGSKRIQEDADEIIKSQFQVPAGYNVVTKAYDLPSDFIIHAVGPSVVDNSHNGIDHDALMYYTAKNILLTAHGLGCKSISIPALSCGEKGFPRKTCAEILLKCSLEYSRGLYDADLSVLESGQNSGIELVRLIQRRQEAVDEFLEVFNEFIEAL